MILVNTDYISGKELEMLGMVMTMIQVVKLHLNKSLKQING